MTVKHASACTFALRFDVVSACGGNALPAPRFVIELISVVFFCCFVSINNNAQRAEKRAISENKNKTTQKGIATRALFHAMRSAASDST